MNKSELFNYYMDIKNDDYTNLTNLTKDNCKKLSLVTSCKNRNSYLNIALQSWLKFPFSEIIIVDWSSDSVISPVNMPENVSVIRVDNQEYYEHSKVRNFKINQAKNNMILSIDCDIILKPKFASNFFIRENSLIMNIDNASGIIGSSIFDKRLFNSLGGFNEALDAGWGFEDLDFYNRAKTKYNVYGFPTCEMIHIEHDDNSRVVHTRTQNKWLSNSLNMKSALDTFDKKNPIFKDRYTIKKSNGIEEQFNVK